MLWRVNIGIALLNLFFFWLNALSENLFGAFFSGLCVAISTYAGMTGWHAASVRAYLQGEEIHPGD